MRDKFKGVKSIKNIFSHIYTQVASIHEGVLNPSANVLIGNRFHVMLPIFLSAVVFT